MNDLTLRTGVESRCCCAMYYYSGDCCYLLSERGKCAYSLERLTLLKSLQQYIHDYIFLVFLYARIDQGANIS